MKENSVAARQMWMSLIIVCTLPSFRLFEPLVANKAGNGAPLSYLVTFLLCAPLLVFYAYSANRQKGKSFFEINRNLFGTWCGGAVSVLYTAWLFFSAAFYLGQYGERIHGTLFYDTDTVVFLLLLLFAVSFVVKKGEGTLARTGSVLSNLILLGLASFSLILLRDVRLTNYLPLSGRDILPTLSGAIPAVSVSAFFPLFFVFGKSTTAQKPYLPYALKSLAAIAAVTVTVSALPLGIFGKETLGKLTVPFFAVTRNVVVLDSLERLESLVAATLIMSDFIMVSILTMAAAQMTCEIFGAKNKSNIIDIMIYGIFVGSLLLSVGEFRISRLVEKWVMPVDIALGVLIPLFWWIAARVRKLPKMA